MHRTFEELGVTVDGMRYGLFTGEADFDETGGVTHIEIETSSFSGKPLSLAVDELVRERIRLRQKYGTAFLDETSPEVRAHRRRFELFQALSDSLVVVFADDIRAYVSEAGMPEPPRYDVA